MERAGAGAQRHVLLLAALFGLSGIAGTVVVASASIVGLALAPRAGLATLPVALSITGGMLATYPASRIMARWGRRAGFLLGTGTAAAGAVAASLGLLRGSFTLFCAGSLLVGALGGVSSYYRFAAMELLPPALRGRAVSTVLAGGVFSGLAGPPLAAAAADLAPVRFVGSYLLIALVALLVILLLPVARLSGGAPPASRASRRTLGAIAADRRFRAAALAAVTAFGAMVLTMVAAPLSLARAGHPFHATAWVIQAHVVAMYLPSFASGPLVERLGAPRMVAAGLALIGACVAVNLLGASVPHHWAALVLLGFGWNLLFVAGTAHLATAHGEADKGSVQGLNDLLVSATAALAAFGAAGLFDAVGWRGLNLAVAGLLAASGLALALLLRQPPALPRPDPAAA